MDEGCANMEWSKIGRTTSFTDLGQKSSCQRRNETEMTLVSSLAKVVGVKGHSSRPQDSHSKDDELRWAVAKSFFEHRSLVEDHMVSYNTFVSSGIQKMMQESIPLEIMADTSSKIPPGLERKVVVSFGQVTIGDSPCTSSGKGEAARLLLPGEARMRGLTYSSPIYVEINMQVFRTSSSEKSKSGGRKPDHSETQKVLIGSLPVMVKSKLCHLRRCQLENDPTLPEGDCHFDLGGYFIVRGSEKALIAQEERCSEHVWITSGKGGWIASCTSRRRGFSAYNLHRTFLKLTVPNLQQSEPVPFPLINVGLPGVESVPLCIVFLALGARSDKEILEVVCYSVDDTEMVQALVPSLLEGDIVLRSYLMTKPCANGIQRVKRDQEAALEFIGSKTKTKILVGMDAAKDVLQSRFLSHIAPSNTRGKMLFLGHMVRMLLMCYLGRRKATSKDDLKNKRLDMAGDLISHQFRKLMGHFQSVFRRRLQKHVNKGPDIEAIEKYVDASIITKGFKTAFSSGNWFCHEGVKNSGVVFDLKRGNPLSTLCQLRETRFFVPATVRVGDEARHPNFSHWGRLCPVDTPDGESCGLVKNLALTSVVSVDMPEENVINLLLERGMETLESIDEPVGLQHLSKVFLNGRWLGVVERGDAEVLVKALKMKRREKALLFSQIGVSCPAPNEVHLHTDRGRILRPLLVVEQQQQRLLLSEELLKKLKNGKGTVDFEKLLQYHVVEFLGSEEEERSTIALHELDLVKGRTEGNIFFTHMEIHPALILGLSAGVIPFPNRNQSSRVLFQAHKHSKQAIGFYTTNYNMRADTSGQQLFYPQKQLVKTHIVDCLGKDEIFNGQNAVVAIACYTGYNQEDSVIMNQSSIDRGLFRSTHYRTFKCEQKSQGELFGKPSVSDIGGRRFPSSNDKLDDDGFPYVGAWLSVGDILAGKIMPQERKEADSGFKIDTSQRLKAHEKGQVDQVAVYPDEVKGKVVKVKLRVSRIPQVGDKFSSMHGQKGIVGMVFNQEDLPFTRQGIVPDLIINPHAFPTRQTLGQMCESALGKVVAKTGNPRIYATPFVTDNSVDAVAQALYEAGYDNWGSEVLFNGHTGRKLEAKIFIGPTFYQRLTHMVEDKMKYRSRGHVHPLTRQPVADRKRHGGVKFGEMERDCMIAHGAAATLQERTFILSDYHTVHLCTVCNQLADVNKDRIPECRFCKKIEKSIVRVEIPYSCKLLVQELLSMGISVRMSSEHL